jgi:aminopeptidase N
VTDEQGRSLPFHHDRSDLLVGVEGIAGQTFKLKFAIDGDFIIREGGDNAWQLPLGEAWFPLPPSLAGMAYTVHSVVRVKKPFVPIAPGNTIARKVEGDYNVVENVVDKPVQFTVVQAGKYTIYEDKRESRMVRVATYGLPNERAAKQLTNLAYGLIDYYEYFLGPFPWSEFNIVQINTYGYGQAPPGTMHITNEAFNPIKPADEEDAISAEQLFSEGINERFAHEIAHQYWAYVVRMPSGEEQWLTESFAEYSAALALKKLRGDAVYNRLVSKWRSRAKDAAGIAPIPYANRIRGDARLSGTQRAALLYAKGPYLLYALHKDVGDTTFLTFLKSYTKTFNFKFGTTKDVAGLLGFMTKKDYKPFFEQYFWGTAMPQ